MERLLRLFLPLLVLANVALVWSGALQAGEVILVGAAVELALLVVASRQVFVAAGRYRRDRAAGRDLEWALEDGLAVLLPRRVARVAALEPRLWVCLYRWIF